MSGSERSADWQFVTHDENDQGSEESVPLLEFEIIHPEEIQPNFAAHNIGADIDNEGVGLVPEVGAPSDEEEEDREPNIQEDVLPDVVQQDVQQDVQQPDVQEDVLQPDVQEDVLQPDVQEDVQHDVVHHNLEADDAAQEDEMEDEQFVLMGGPFDGGDTESSAEMEDEDDRIESDQSTDHSQHSDDNSNMSNIDIGDLMADPTLIRQYVHQPNRHLNVTLNTVLVLVIAVAIGLGIGHAVGSKRERLLQRRMWQDNFSSLKSSPVDSGLQDRVKVLAKREKDLVNQLQNAKTVIKENEDVIAAMKLDIEKYENMSHDQQKEVKMMETIAQARFAELVTLKDQVEKLRSESLQQQEEKATISTRSIEEVTELRYKLMQAKDANIDLLTELNEQKTISKNMEHLISDLNATHERKLKEKEKNLKNIINMLEVEKGDLEQEVGNLRYSLHPGNDGAHASQAFYKDRVNQLETEKSDLIKQVGSMRYSGYHVHDGSEASAGSHGYNDQDEDQSEIEKLNRTVSELTNKLATEQGKSEMWQRLYITSQKENKRTRTDNSSRDFFGCVTHLLKNVTVPQNLSRMFKEKVDLSLDALKYIYNVFKGEHTEQNNEQARKSFVKKGKFQKSESKKNQKYHADDKENKKEGKEQHTWRKTVEEVLNKTKSSMSDVSKQIHDTWKQVKNLSKDLWEKHEPTLEKFHTKISQEVKAMSANLQKKIKQTTEKFFRKWNKKRHNNHRQEQDDDDDDEQFKQRYGATTSRRGHENQRAYHTPKFHSRENGRKGNWHTKRLGKLKKRIAKLGKKKYCKMDYDDALSIFNDLDGFTFQLEFMDVPISDEHWHSCQWRWWINSLNSHTGNLMHPPSAEKFSECMKSLHDWQRDVVKESGWLCKSRSGHTGRKDGKICGKNIRHVQTHHSNDDQAKYNKHSNPGHRHQKNRHRKHDHKTSDRHHPTRSHRHFISQSIQSSASTMEKESPFKVNCTFNPPLRCDPFDSTCSDESLSWYVKHMSYRDAQRLAEEMEVEKSEWLFSRGKARNEIRQKEEEGEKRAAWQFQVAKGREENRNEERIVDDIDPDSESSCFDAGGILFGDCQWN
ncbi:hypothetical protein FSP39_005047 [Pinctada imbricata]|uniref:Uncharacterized protein n=1 Tax=Pinctada imbricata TaxID=66713 RepID=A0AA88Y378_PINIB|nr:hypothetical protein FSP39_005047 [Pinctada imbricata]